MPEKNYFTLYIDRYLDENTGHIIFKENIHTGPGGYYATNRLELVEQGLESVVLEVYTSGSNYTYAVYYYDSNGDFLGYTPNTASPMGLTEHIYTIDVQIDATHKANAKYIAIAMSIAGPSGSVDSLALVEPPSITPEVTGVPSFEEFEKFNDTLTFYLDGTNIIDINGDIDSFLTYWGFKTKDSGERPSEYIFIFDTEENIPGYVGVNATLTFFGIEYDVYSDFYSIILTDDSSQQVVINWDDGFVVNSNYIELSQITLHYYNYKLDMPLGWWIKKGLEKSVERSKNYTDSKTFSTSLVLDIIDWAGTEPTVAVKSIVGLEPNDTIFIDLDLDEIDFEEISTTLEEYSKIYHSSLVASLQSHPLSEPEANTFVSEPIETLPFVKGVSTDLAFTVTVDTLSDMSMNVGFYDSDMNLIVSYVSGPPGNGNDVTYNVLNMHFNNVTGHTSTDTENIKYLVFTFSVAGPEPYNVDNLRYSMDANAGVALALYSTEELSVNIPLKLKVFKGGE